VSLLNRLFDLFKKPAEAQPSVDEPGLAVVVEAFDPAEADSAVLARSHRWVAERPVVLRHHLRLPADRLGEAARILAQDGWKTRTVSESMSETAPETEGFVLVHAVRVQRLDALHCAQERARMAGLAQRLGGDSTGWDALQREPPA
jgi:hypothetical protein